MQASRGPSSTAGPVSSEAMRLLGAPCCCGAVSRTSDTTGRTSFCCSRCVDVCRLDMREAMLLASIVWGPSLAPKNTI
jgi:hypothetical protein